MSYTRLDPSGTTTIRSRFAARMVHRFKLVAASTIELIVADNAFGLDASNSKVVVHNAGQFVFMNDVQKVAAFRRWLKDQIRRKILTVDVQGKPWTAEFVYSVYRKGIVDAYIEANQTDIVKSPDAYFRGADRTRSDFLRDTFAAPTTTRKLELIYTRSFTQLEGITDAMDAQLSAVLASGLANGLGATPVAREITKTIDGIGRYRAELLARTECLLGDTLVDGAVVRAAFRRWYDGPVVDISTRSGRKFSATPNHPMLTNRGWVGAGFLNDGDYLVSHDGQKDSGTSGNEHIKRRPASISQIFDSLVAKGVRKRERCGQPDFHGDGSNCDVDVFCSHRELLVGCFSSLNKPIIQNFLSPSDFSSFRFCSFCTGLLSVDQQVCSCAGSKWNSIFNKAASDECMVGFESFANRNQRFSSSICRDNCFDGDVIPDVVVNAASFPGIQLSICIGACDPTLAQNFSDLFLIRAKSFSDLGLSQSGKIQLDDVISTAVRPFSGHVYNLETPYGYFTIDGLYTGNTIRVYAEGQLDSFERLGVDDLELVPEWTIAREGVCRKCKAKAGKQYTIETARGLIPLHPRCRCIWTLRKKTKRFRKIEM